MAKGIRKYFGCPLCVAGDVYGVRTPVRMPDSWAKGTIRDILIGLQTERRLSQPTGPIFSVLLHNPLVLTPLPGIMWSALELPLPEAMVTLFKLLGKATVPCALV